MQLGWIDFSKTERQSILSVLDLLSEKGTLDELGIAPVRDGFSNRFFPGTSTIQTRAKYFFIVPYALKELELSSETNPNTVLKTLDKIEKECGEVFYKQNENESGIIGKRSLQRGGWVKRAPSDIYWSGLRRYGIFTGGNISLAEYVKASCAWKQDKTTLQSLGNRNDTAEEGESDDKDAGNVFKRQFWKMPLYNKKWFDNLSIRLTKEEGKFLKEQIIFACPNKMLSYILENDMAEVLDCATFRDLGALMHKFPERMQEDYRRALAFSDFIYVARTLYNIMIFDGGNTNINDEFERLKEEMTKRADIDIDDILENLEISKAPLENFLKQVQKCMRNMDIDGMKKHIKDNEIRLKGANRAKTAHPGEFELREWEKGDGELNYRFSDAKMILRDIFESEGKLDVKS